MTTLATWMTQSCNCSSSLQHDRIKTHKQTLDQPGGAAPEGLLGGGPLGGPLPGGGGPLGGAAPVETDNKWMVMYSTYTEVSKEREYTRTARL